MSSVHKQQLGRWVSDREGGSGVLHVTDTSPPRSSWLLQCVKRHANRPEKNPAAARWITGNIIVCIIAKHAAKVAKANNEGVAEDVVDASEKTVQREYITTVTARCSYVGVCPMLEKFQNTSDSGVNIKNRLTARKYMRYPGVWGLAGVHTLRSLMNNSQGHIA